MSNEQVKKTASERIQDVEMALANLYQVADNIARDLIMVKEAVKLLGNKLDAVVKATNGGETLSDEVISRIMIENNVDELKGRVENLKRLGILAAAEAVEANSFVVVRELDENGSIRNPRIQGIVANLHEVPRAKLPGSKVGDIVDLGENKFKAEVLEIYTVQQPQVQEEAAPEATAETPASA